MLGKQFVGKVLRYPCLVIGLLLLLMGYDLFDEGNQCDLSSWGNVLVSALALTVAFYAYEESRIMRKNSTFSALFSQLINNHKNRFGDDVLKKTALVVPFESSIDKNDNVFSNFYKFYESHHKAIKDPTNNLSIIGVWDEYVQMIKEGTKFSHCFKFVYNEIKTVLDEKTIDDNEKKHYMSIIQSYMNNDELFCYLINLLQHYGNYYREEEYKDSLCRYGFFGDLMQSRDKHYASLINDLRTTVAGKDLRYYWTFV